MARAPHGHRRVGQLGFLFTSAVLALMHCAGAAVRAQDRPAVGHGPDGLAAVDHVGLLTQGERRIAAVAGARYGYTEEVLDAGDSHQRIAGRVAGGFDLLPRLALGARFVGRYDAHDGGPDGSDSGFVGESALLARYQLPAAPRLRVGAEAALRFPGADGVSRGLQAISLDLSALATYAPATLPLHAGLVLGFRLDRAREGVVDPARLSPSDRIALGASDAHALLVGLAGSYRVGAWDLLGEWSWEPAVGSDGAGALESPMRLSAGARYWPTRALHLELLATISPSARPELATTTALYPIEPRVQLRAAVGLYFPFTRQQRPAPERATNAPAARPAAEPTALSLLVLTEDGGAPVAGAAVTVMAAEAIHEGLTDADGRARLQPLPAGVASLTVQAEGFREHTQELSIAAGTTTEAAIALALDLPEGQIRGTVHGFDGAPIEARVHVLPGDTWLHADAEGNFVVDVKPGTYRVIISAQGYRTQTHRAEVEDNGVTVLVVDMRRAQ